MLLATRCPSCETVFRLQPAQLSLRHGLVRCGHCQEVFDASGSLFDVSQGSDFSTARKVSVAEVLDAPSEVRPSGADFSPSAWDPWAPRPTPLFDERFRHDVDSAAAQSNYVGATAPTAAQPLAQPRVQPQTQQQAQPHPSADLHAAATGNASPTGHEPALADAPLEPFAYNAEPAADEAPRVWHKSERAPITSTAADAPPTAHTPRADKASSDEPTFNESNAFHAFPDNEPHFGTTGVGAAGLGSTHPHPYSTDSEFDDLGDFDKRPRPAAATPDGEPFSVNPVHDDDDDPFPVVRETRPVERKRLAWIIGGSVAAVLLVVALLAQLAWWQRETVLVYFPSTQMLYVKACAQLGCQVSAPHDIDGLQVEPSDLRQVDGPHKLELRMPLRNRFNVALAYPAVELTLLDDQNNVALRRVLMPQEYVPPGTSIAAGLPPHMTQTMIVHLDTGNAVASNFRVQIFYP